MNKQALQKIIMIAGFLIILLLSFHYAFLTDFPIGHDAGHHVSSAIKIGKNGIFNFANLSPSLYPIPLTVFAIFHQISNIAWPSLFIFTICFFLFLTALSWAYFTTKIFHRWEIGIISGLFLASSRWLGDALRIGFMAEVWGWFVFIICSYLLINRKFLMLLMMLIVLYFSHPLALAVFLIVFTLYGILIIFSKSSIEDKLFIYKIASVLLLVLGIILIFLPEKIYFFDRMINSAYLEGARPLKAIFTDMDKRRIFIYLFSLIGIIISIPNWPKNGIKYLYALLFVSLILSQLYLWGIKFWVFRFYPYLEMAVAAFASIGLFAFIKLIIPKSQTKRAWTSILLLIMVSILIWPNIQANRVVTIWQMTDYQANAFCPRSDREAFSWIKDHIPAQATFITPTKWGAWLAPLGQRNVLEKDNFSDFENNPSALKEIIQKHQLTPAYIYLSSVQPENTNIENNSLFFESVYHQNGVRIYLIKKENLEKK